MLEIRALIRPTVINHGGDRLVAAWVAIGLEYFICGSGDTPQDALAAFDRSVRATVLANEANGRPQMEGIKPAPDFYLEQAKGAQPMADDRLTPDNDDGDISITLLKVAA